MFPKLAPLLLTLVADVAALVKKYGGIPGLLAAERKTVSAIRVTVRDWKAAKAVTSDGGKVVTLDEARVIAVDLVAAIEDAIGPLLNVPTGTDPAAFSEELAGKVLPPIFHWLTGQRWEDVAAAIAA
jgi:hypothetical protein